MAADAEMQRAPRYTDMSEDESNSFSPSWTRETREMLLPDFALNGLNPKLCKVALFH